MVWSAAASAAIIELFFSFGNYLFSIVKSKGRFGNAAKRFLKPTPSIVSNFQTFYTIQRFFQSIHPFSAVHFLGVHDFVV
jgi:hypothetical protein